MYTNCADCGQVFVTVLHEGLPQMKKDLEKAYAHTYIAFTTLHEKYPGKFYTIVKLISEALLEIREEHGDLGYALTPEIENLQRIARSVKPESLVTKGGRAIALGI